MTYTVKLGETITDVLLNTTGTINNISAILEANELTTWTPELTPGQILIIPDGLEIQDNVLQQMKTYPSTNSFIGNIKTKIITDFNILSALQNTLTSKNITPFSATLYAVNFISKTEGWVCGQDGNIYHTINGGDTWEKQTSGSTDLLFSIFFTDPLNGWVSGENSVILHTSDKGVTWTPQTTGVPGGEGILCIYFISSTVGWCCTEDGSIIHTIDGGATWAVQVTGSANVYRSIFFTDSLNGWVCGDSGLIAVTGDGGATWTDQTSGTTEILRSIYFISTDVGYVCGDYGIILKTIDSGSTWVELSTTIDSLYKLNSIYFISTENGFVCGENGEVFITSNAGLDWVQKNTETSEVLWSIYPVDNKTMYSVGETGIVLKFA